MSLTAPEITDVPQSGASSRAHTPSALQGERCLTFGVDGEQLVGILHLPLAGLAQASEPVGVVIVVGGPQYRVGSHRQFVHLARSVAQAGHPVLRFDVRGMGDATGALRSFEQICADLGAAIDAFVDSVPRMRKVVLWGLCDGASAALLYVQERDDPRVAGLCLANPWVRSAQTQARTRVKHYYSRRIRDPEFWSKLLRGGVAVKAVGELARAVLRGRRPQRAATHATYQDRMLAGWQRFAGPTLLLLSENDYTAKEFEEYVALHPDWQRAAARATVSREVLHGMDHTFSSAAHRQTVAATTLHWLAGLAVRDTAR